LAMIIGSRHCVPRTGVLRPLWCCAYHRVCLAETALPQLLATGCHFF
jgi:hypothetical protein